MLLISVFFASCSTLAFEVLLTRVFSISQWNHLSFMVISIALFGFGASGTFLSFAEIRKKDWSQKLRSENGQHAIVVLLSLTMILSFLTVNRLPLDYFRLPVDPFQAVLLVAAYLLLALPFFFSGLIISIAYVSSPEKTGLIYFAAMFGSAVGAAMPFPLLLLLDEGRLIIISALVALIPALGPIMKGQSPQHAGSAKKKRYPALATVPAPALAALAIYLLTPAGETITDVVPSPYKGLPQVLKFPSTQITARHSSIRGRIDRITTPYIRFAPGLSLRHTDRLPAQDAVYTDGDNQLVLYDLVGGPRNTRFAKRLLSYVGYFLQGNPERVLLVLAGGGSSVACAAASGARSVTILEDSAHIADMLRRHYPYHVVNRHQRPFLARDDQLYDVVHIENWGASIPGVAVLNQEHMLTIEALTEYWNHLTSSGVVVISRKLLLPPSDTVRLWSAAHEALMATGIAQPARHLAMLRNFDTFTLIMSKKQFHDQRVRDFAESLNFDLVFLQGMDPQEANRFHVFDEPYHHGTIDRLTKMYQSQRQSDFFRQYVLDVAPQSDLRPFPARFLKWSQVVKLYHSTGNRFYNLLMSGEIVVVIVFLEALLVATILLVFPLLVGTRSAPKPHMSALVYFFAVGAGFMFVEIYFIKRFIILIGDPVISFTLVIAGLLFFSSLGGIWLHGKSRPGTQRVIMILIAVLILEAVIFELVLPGLLKTPAVVRYTTILLLLLPSGFLMGIPFPLAMRDLVNLPVQRAYAWSVNGCASVLTAIAAAQVAISWGIAHVAAAGIIAYGIAALAVRGNGIRFSAFGIR